MADSDLDIDGVPAGAPLVPARITAALDARGLEGPGVDLLCGTFEGNPAGDVDAWEAGTAVPDRGQVRMLAALVHMPVAHFYTPIEDWERTATGFVCVRSGPRKPRNGGIGRGCHPIGGPPAPPTPDRTERQGRLF